MLLFFDTEFTGLHKNATLISLGIVAEMERRSMRSLMTLIDHRLTSGFVRM